MRAHRTLTVSLILALTLAIPASAAAKRLIIGGSTSVLPLAQKLSAAYHHATHAPEPKVSGGQSDIGVAGAASGRFDIGDSSRDPLSTDPHGLVFTKIARDGICVVTNNQNPVANFSQETIQKIFSGAVRDWSEVPGAHVSGPIELFDRDGASGTQDAFQNIFMGQNLRVSPSASQRPSNGRVQQAIASNKNAIGYVDFNFTKGLHTVPYRGVACTLRNAKSGQYGGVRNFWLVSRGKASGAAAAFIKWTKSRAARKLIATNWVPLK